MTPVFEAEFWIMLLFFVALLVSVYGIAKTLIDWGKEEDT